MAWQFLYTVERINKQRINTQHYSFYFITLHATLYSFVLQPNLCPVLRKYEFAYILSNTIIN